MISEHLISKISACNYCLINTKGVDSAVRDTISTGTGQLVPKSTRTLVNLYPFFSQLVP